jgi:hypothetical protein
LALLPALLSHLYTRLQTGDFGLQRSCEQSRLRNLAGPHRRLTADVGIDADRVDHVLYISDRVTSSQPWPSVTGYDFDLPVILRGWRHGRHHITAAKVGQKSTPTAYVTQNRRPAELARGRGVLIDLTPYLGTGFMLVG